MQSWIVTSVSKGILPHLFGAEMAQIAWNKLVVTYASGLMPQIHESKTQLHTLQRENTSIEYYVQKVMEITNKLVAVQYPIANNDLVEFVLAGIGPAYRPFNWSLEAHQENILFDALYGLLLNKKWQLKRDETLNVIEPTTHYAHRSFSPNHGRGQGKGNRGRGHSQNHAYSQRTQQHGF